LLRIKLNLTLWNQNNKNKKLKRQKES